MKTTIVPKLSEDKHSDKTGKNYVVFTDEYGKKYTVFEEAAIDQLRNNFGNVIEVEIATSGNFTNIRKVYGVVSTNENVGEQKQITRKAKVPYEAEGFKPKTASMLTAYAKDIVIAAMGKDEGSIDVEELAARMEAAGAEVLKVYKDLLSAL